MENEYYNAEQLEALLKREKEMPLEDFYVLKKSLHVHGFGFNAIAPVGTPIHISPFYTKNMTDEMLNNYHAKGARKQMSCGIAFMDGDKPIWLTSIIMPYYLNHATEEDRQKYFAVKKAVIDNRERLKAERDAEFEAERQEKIRQREERERYEKTLKYKLSVLPNKFKMWVLRKLCVTLGVAYINVFEKYEGSSKGNYEDHDKFVNEIDKRIDKDKCSNAAFHLCGGWF